jgi:signal peptidase I
MSFWSDRNTIKRARELVGHARKLLRINRDILDPRRAAETAAATDALREAVESRSASAVPGLREKLENQLAKNFPRPKDSGLRENVEVLLVAVLVAMAVRTFVIQPFKIPTGSMQPTLYGIIKDFDCDRNVPFVERWTDIVMKGKWPSAERTGLFQGIIDFAGWSLFGKWPEGASGCDLRGDHIFVDKFTYHFRKPRRGEVIVFETDEIADLPEASRGRFYIKRLIGLPGDKITIDPPRVLVNDQILNERDAFKRIYSMQEGYNGYELPEPPPLSMAKYINKVRRSYDVPLHRLFVLGDNTRSSLDGRFWGSLPERALVGRAVCVYWPFTHRFGLVD